MEGLVDIEKESLIINMDQARSRLNQVLARIDADTRLYPDWKLKQFLDHVAGWDDAVLAAVRSHARGDVPEVTAPRGIDYYNAQTVSTREALPLDRTRREFERTRELLKQAIRDLPDDRFHQPFVSPWGEVATLTQVVKVFVHHELTHARELEEILNASQTA